MAEYKPYLEVSEEVLIRFRTDMAGMSLIRGGLMALAGDPTGLDDDVAEIYTDPRDAEELLVAMPAVTGTRRSPEARLRATINAQRQETKRRNEEFERLTAIVERIEKELPDVVEAAREAVDGSTTPSAPSPDVSDETAEGAGAEPSSDEADAKE